MFHELAFYGFFVVGFAFPKFALLDVAGIFGSASNFEDISLFYEIM